MKDYYAILGIAPTAEEIVIRAAWKAMAQRYHPDRFEGGAEQAHARMAEINEAYDVLSDPEKRSAYERKRARGDTGEQDDAPGMPVDPFETDWLKAVGSRASFRNDPELLTFARQLLFEGNLAAARALDEAVREVSREVPTSWIINRICEDFNIETKAMWKRRIQREAKAREDAIWEKMREKARQEAASIPEPIAPPPPMHTPPPPPPAAASYAHRHSSFLLATIIVVLFCGLMIWILQTLR